MYFLPEPLSGVRHYGNTSSPYRHTHTCIKTHTHTHNSCSERPLQRPEEERESRSSGFFCPKEAFKKVRATTSMVHIFSNGVRAEKKRKRRKKDFRMMGMMDLCNSTEHESNTAFTHIWSHISIQEVDHLLAPR